MNATLRALLIQAANAECEECHVVGKVEIHHKDRDRSNNHPDNLAVLCRPCHLLKHPKGSRDKGKTKYNRVAVLFSDGEYAELVKRAGDVPLSAWIRKRAIDLKVDASRLRGKAMMRAMVDESRDVIVTVGPTPKATRPQYEKAAKKLGDVLDTSLCQHNMFKAACPRCK